MKILACFAGFAILATVGCGGGDMEMNNPDVTGPGGPGPTVDYPNGDVGYKIGQQIANLSFLWNPHGITDMGAAPQKVTMADFYAMRKSGTKMLYLSGAAEWCGPCNMEADELTGMLSGKYYLNQADPTMPGMCNGAPCQSFLDYLNTKGGPQVLEVVQVLMQNVDYTPADTGTISRWETRHMSPYGVGIDPKQQVQTYIPKEAIPQSLFIRLDTMVITNQLVGEPSPYDLMNTFMNELKKVAP